MRTPGPWILQDYDEDEQGWGILTQRGIDGYMVAYVPRWPFAAYERDEDNAAFIVRACNSHDKLVEACRLAFAHICEGCSSENGPCADDGPPNGNRCCAAEAGNALRDALKEVEA